MKPKRPRDTNQLAKMIVDLTTRATKEEAPSVKAKAGHLGGVKGGKARAAKMTDTERSASASRAAAARWKKR